MASPSILLCVLVLFAILLNTSAEKRLPLFVFGDSLFDPGNNQHLNSSAGGGISWPYGETFFQYPTGRLSDGRIVPDFIAEFAKMQILPPYQQPQFIDGANFASAGAGVLVAGSPGAITLGEQLSYFEKMENKLRGEVGDEKVNDTLMRAIYLFSIGGNDYFNFYSNHRNGSTQSEKQEYVSMVIGNLTNVLHDICSKGGRKIAFQNVGPMGCLPTVKAMNPELGDGCVEDFLAVARLHNKILADVLENFESQFPGFKYSIFDYYHSLKDRIHHPSKYGFEVGDTACCGSGPYNGESTCGKTEETFHVCQNASEYVFFDSGHTTEHANHQFAKLMWSGEPNITGPYNMKLLFGRED